MDIRSTLLSLLGPLILLHMHIITIYAIPRLRIVSKHAAILRNDSAINTPNSTTYFYNQTLDHFGYGPLSYTTFRQKYIVDATNWGGANSSSPILAYLGDEEPLDLQVPVLGFLTENAHFFKALIVHIEHRFYGESAPLGSQENAMKNETIRGYFNSAQALADFAEVLLHVKQQFSTPNSPIIVLGGSYGGMLASWFRLKYPHIVLGALASSAPILYFDDIIPQDAGYYSVATKDFKDVSMSCYETIQKSWSLIDEVASLPNGLSMLSGRFKTCSPLNNTKELKDFLVEMYAGAAQYDFPSTHPIATLCNAINETRTVNKTDTLDQIFAAVISMNRNLTCYNMSAVNYPSETYVGYNWQECSEMVMPIGIGENDTMFQVDPFDLDDFINNCKLKYGVEPRPHWITNYYGGHDIKLVLRQFGSNIIFSNGLRDPYSSGGVIEDISESILAVTTPHGAHVLDILKSRKDDPSWLVEQRNLEVKIINGWIKQYYVDLESVQKSG